MGVTGTQGTARALTESGRVERKPLPRMLTARRFKDFSQKALSGHVRRMCMQTDLWKRWSSNLRPPGRNPRAYIRTYGPHLEVSRDSLLNMNGRPRFNRH